MLLAGLGAGAFGVAASAAPVLRLAPSSGKPASWWDRTFLSLQAAGLAEWTSVVGQTFILETPAGRHGLKVAAVTAFAASGPRPRTLGRSQAFSVAFESLGGAPLPAGEGMYRLAHGTHPSLPIFMSAPTAFGRKTRLIAVFN
ncbi:MAG TPA: hypothetical protein VEW26_16350 [Allosphingosinicella sp.]|nr:hypothetical protein [Allosphingosinicella sp.]